MPISTLSIFRRELSSMLQNFQLSSQIISVHFSHDFQKKKIRIKCFLNAYSNFYTTGCMDDFRLLLCYSPINTCKQFLGPTSFQMRSFGRKKICTSVCIIHFLPIYVKLYMYYCYPFPSI